MSFWKYPSLNLKRRARRFKALGHPLRILIMNLIRGAPRHGEELAAILNISPSTVAHHLFILQQSGWIASRRVQYYQIYTLNEQALNDRLSEHIDLPTEDLQRYVEPDAYRRKVLNEAFRDGRLDEIPSAQLKREIVLSEIAQSLEVGRTYKLREINRVLVEFYDDIVEVRAALVEGGWIVSSDVGFRRSRSTSQPR
jgi:biotin operon repressor